jgi:hypothetical protein
MTKTDDSTISQNAKDFLAEKFGTAELVLHPVQGGYSRNRRAVVDVDGKSVFAKEVDVDLLPDNGAVELGWLKKDYAVIAELAKRKLDVSPEWAELHMDGHLLLLPSYKQEDNWQWKLPEDEGVQNDYIQAVVDATKSLEDLNLSDELTDKLTLKPFVSNEIAVFEGIEPLFNDETIRGQLIERYEAMQQEGGYLADMATEMLVTLKSDNTLRQIQEQTRKLADLPNDSFNHCDVRSDNIAYNTETKAIKFVDWNWASYAPKKFGATEFLIDMARRGIDISRWYGDASIEMVAGMIGYYMIRSLKPPLYPGSVLRDMQAETAAVANYVYNQLGK